jgi:hypothetical protein
VKPKQKFGPGHLFPPSVIAAGYSVPQRAEDPVVRAHIPRHRGISNRPLETAPPEPPSYDRVRGHILTPPRPPSPPSIHPYPYTNHLRSTSDVTVPDDSRSPRRHLRDLETIDTRSDTALNRLSLAVNEPTSPLPTSENGSEEGLADFTPLSSAHGVDSLKSMEYTPYPSSTLLPLSAAGAPRVDPPRSAKR